MTLAKRRVKESQRRLRKQEAQSNRACGIRIEMKLAQGTVEAPPSAITEISGDPSIGQTVTLKPGTQVPPRGGYLVVDATSSGPGVLGKVTATSKLRGGRTKLSLRPATLDQAYERFDLRFDGSLDALSDSSSLRTEEGATASSAQSSASKLTLFRCKGPRIKKPDIVVDLTPLRVSSEIDVQRRYVHFLISGRPLLRLRFEMTAGAKCQLDENVRVFVPVAGPVGIELAPVVELGASADSKLDFELAPRIAVGFERGGPSGNQDFRVFNTAGGPSVTLHGSLGVDAFAGGAIGVSVGGRAGLRGKFGPAVSARSSAGAGRICADVNGALRIGLDAYANVFIANLTIQLGKGDFLPTRLYSGCVGGGQGGVGGGSGGASLPGEGGGEGLGGSVRERIGAGGSHTCAIRSDDMIVCWGDNHDGQSTPPPGTFEAISAGYLHSCAIRSDDTVACWGYNDDGRSTPPPGTFKAVSAGGGHTCAIRSDDTIACWGTNAFGESTAPPGTFGAVSAGVGHSCAIRSDDTVACWGDNDYGESTPSAGAFKAIGAGYRHSCAIRSDDTIACWGANASGRSTPPPGIFKAISGGRDHTCAIRSDDTIACWGVNAFGESTPPPGTFKAVSAGNSHSCAIRSDDTIACWGANAYGESTPPPGSF